MFQESKPDELNEHSEGTQDGAGNQAGDEQFTEGIDASKLNPELQPTFKGMQAAYTKKTQAIARERKSLEEKEQKLEELRSEYEQKILNLPKETKETKEEKILDTANMTAEQRQAWEALEKHFDTKLEKVVAEKEKSYQSRIDQLQGHIGHMEWRDFTKTHPKADKLRPRMVELRNAKGGNNCPLSLDEIYLLAQGEKGLKQAGAEEYKESVKTKKKVMTTIPDSTAGTEAELDFHKGPGVSRNQRRENRLKAFQKAQEETGIGEE